MPHHPFKDYNNILDRNIDVILSRNRNSAQQLPRRPNKYMSKYGPQPAESKKEEENRKKDFHQFCVSKPLNEEYTGSKLLSKALEMTETASNKSPYKVQTTQPSADKKSTLAYTRPKMFNYDDKSSKTTETVQHASLPKQSSLDGCDANSSDNNSISTSSSVVTRCEVKSQPPTCFSSIAFVNANRVMQLQLQREQMLQMQQKLSSTGFGRQLPAIPLTGPSSASLLLSKTDEGVAEEEEDEEDEVANRFEQEIDPDVVEAELEKRIGFYSVANLSDTTEDLYAAAAAAVSAAEDEEWLEAHLRPNYAFSLGY